MFITKQCLRDIMDTMQFQKTSTSFKNDLYHSNMGGYVNKTFKYTYFKLLMIEGHRWYLWTTQWLLEQFAVNRGARWLADAMST